MGLTGAPRTIALLVCLMFLVGCDFGPTKRYAAEVGYYHGGDLRLDLWGDFLTLEECRDAAIGRINIYFAQQRAQSWSRLLKNVKSG